MLVSAFVVVVVVVVVVVAFELLTSSAVAVVVAVVAVEGLEILTELEMVYWRFLEYFASHDGEYRSLFASFDTGRNT